VLAAPGITFAETSYDAAIQSDALLILTDWDEFADLDLDRLRTSMRYPLVIDGRNLYRPEAMAAKGFDYHSVGRRDAKRATPASAKVSALRRGKG